MTTIHDHLGRQLVVQPGPQRIISLCPAITETLLELGSKSVVGRTKYCIFPQEIVEDIAVVGGTKTIDEAAIHALNPTLIIAEKEENTKEIVETLAAHYPVFVCQVETVDDAYRLIETLGTLASVQQAAVALIDKIQKTFAQLPALSGNAAYIMWRKPYMAVGKTTYITSLLEMLGFTNPITKLDGRYPAVTIEDLQQAKLDYVLLSSEPFPFSEKHRAEFEPYLANAKIIFVDGEMFWYGARMLKAAHYFNTIQQAFN